MFIEPESYNDLVATQRILNRGKVPFDSHGDYLEIDEEHISKARQLLDTDGVSYHIVKETNESFTLNPFKRKNFNMAVDEYMALVVDPDKESKTRGKSALNYLAAKYNLMPKELQHHIASKLKDIDKNTRYAKTNEQLIEGYEFLAQLKQSLADLKDADKKDS